MTTTPDWLEAARSMLMATSRLGHGALKECRLYGSQHAVGARHFAPEGCPACRLRAVIRDEEARRAQAKPAEAISASGPGKARRVRFDSEEWDTEVCAEVEVAADGTCALRSATVIMPAELSVSLSDKDVQQAFALAKEGRP